MFGLIGKRILAALSTTPAPCQWTSVGRILVCTAAASLPLGICSGFLSWNPVKEHRIVIQGVVASLVSPAIIEEVCFRAALLPHPAVDGVVSVAKFFRKSLFPLATFIVYHLLNPRRKSREVFSDWRFLALAGILGASCTAAYYTTGGSVWAAILLHWLPVDVWLFCLGGYQKLQYGPN